MLIIQLTGLSGAGKSTIANLVAEKMLKQNIPVEVLDGDIYRNSVINKGLGFSMQDRKTNLERLFFISKILASHKVVAIIAAINPFEDLRSKFASSSTNIRTVWIKCDLQTLLKRDPKGLYKKAMLPFESAEKLNDFTGISSPYEEPVHPDLVIDTTHESIEKSVASLYSFIISEKGKSL